MRSVDLGQMDQEEVLENDRDRDARAETDRGRGGKLAQLYGGLGRLPLLILQRENRRRPVGQ